MALWIQNVIRVDSSRKLSIDLGEGFSVDSGLGHNSFLILLGDFPGVDHLLKV